MTNNPITTHPLKKTLQKLDEAKTGKKNLPQEASQLFTFINSLGL